MKKLVRIYSYLVIVLLTLGPIFGWAGGSQGGGGGGKICIDPTTQEKKISLLEFWEAENGLAPFKEKIQIPESDVSVDAQVLRAIRKVQKVNHELSLELLRAYRHVSSPKVKFTRPDMKVRPPTDTIQPFEGHNCSEVGIGMFFDGRDQIYYSDDPLERLNYDERILSGMSKTHQAGFWFHEAAYYVFRNFSGQETSILARILNVFAFSNQKIPNLAAKPKGSTASYKCKTLSKSERKIDGEFYLHLVSEKVLFVPVTFGIRLTSIVSGDFSGALYMFEKVPSVYLDDSAQGGGRSELGMYTDYSGARLEYGFGPLDLLSQNLRGRQDFQIREWLARGFVKSWVSIFHISVHEDAPNEAITCKHY